jgi:hypothetical protein
MNDFDVEENAVDFDDEDLEGVYKDGFRLGQEFVHCNWNGVKIEEDTDLDEFQDLVMSACYEAEDNFRQYSPFEFTAKAFNDAGNSDEVWENYEAGISDGIEDAINFICTEEALCEMKEYNREV